MVVVVADQAAVAERDRCPFGLHRVTDGTEAGHVGEGRVTVEVNAPAHPDAARPSQDDGRLGVVGTERGVGPVRESVPHLRVRARRDDGAGPQDPSEPRFAVAGEGHRVLFAVEQTERHLGVVLPARRAATDDACRVGDAETSQVELMGAVLRRGGPLRDREAPVRERHPGERAERLGRGGARGPRRPQRGARDRRHSFVVVVERDGEVATWVPCAEADKPLDKKVKPVFWATPGTSLKTVMLSMHKSETAPVALFNDDSTFAGAIGVKDVLQAVLKRVE